MNLPGDSLAIVLFGVAALVAAALGALVTHGWRSKLLWLLAIAFAALTVVWLKWPKLSPYLGVLWKSNALVVLTPVVVVALIRGPQAAPKPKPLPAPFAHAPPIIRPKPRFRQPRGESGSAEG